MHITIGIIVLVLCIGFGILIGMMIISRFVDNSVRTELQNEIEVANRYRGYYMVLNEWMAENQRGKNIADYFEERDIRKIAIYGMTELGCRLYSELINRGIEVICAIDKSNFSCPFHELKLLNIEEVADDLTVREAQMVVVTPFYSFHSIKKELEKYVSCQICSIKDIVSEL